LVVQGNYLKKISCFYISFFIFFSPLSIALADPAPGLIPTLTLTPTASVSNTTVSPNKRTEKYPIPIRSWEVGQSVSYQMTNYINSEVVYQWQQTLSIVSEEKHKGKRYVFLEFENALVDADGNTKYPARAKFLIPAQDQNSIESFIYNGNVDSIMPMVVVSEFIQGMPANYSPINEDNKTAMSTLLGTFSKYEKDEFLDSTETLNVPLSTPAGDFVTAKYENLNSSDGSDSLFWRDPQIPIFGIAKEQYITGTGTGKTSITEMVIKAVQLTGAKSRINKRMIVATKENLKRLFSDEAAHFSMKITNPQLLVKHEK
jgi:hypothetical protein